MQEAVDPAYLRDALIAETEKLEKVCMQTVFLCDVMKPTELDRELICNFFLDSLSLSLIYLCIVLSFLYIFYHSHVNLAEYMARCFCMPDQNLGFCS